MESDSKGVHSIELDEFYLGMPFLAFGIIYRRIPVRITGKVRFWILLPWFSRDPVMESSRKGVHSIEQVEFYLLVNFRRLV